MTAIQQVKSQVKRGFRWGRLLQELTRNEIQTRYLGSFMGVAWAFVLPILNVLILWFVFEVGFRAAAIGDAPFFPWLVCGMIPWFFVADGIAGATAAVTGNAYLVKKVLFRVEVLPLVKILAALCIHLFFVVSLFLIAALYDLPLTAYSLQVPYYLLASVLLVCGIGWLTSALVVFLPDIGQAVGVLLQFLFWLTPIFWPIAAAPPQFHPWLKLNPVFYIVEGYRNSLIFGRWFWQEPAQTAYFWCVALGLLGLGWWTFRRLKPHFADVL